MRLLLTTTFVAVAALSGLVQGGPLAEEELALRIRSLSQNCNGAAPDTGLRLLKTFTEQVAYKEVDVKSAVITEFGSVDPSSQERSASTSDSASSNYRIRTGFSSSDCPRDLRNRVPDDDFVSTMRKTLGAAREYRTILLTKSYQDLSAYYQLLVPVGTNIDDARAGQKISFKMKLFVVSDYRMFFYAVGGLVTFSPETTMLSCANGHKYAPASGYKFCPIDGLPLK